MSSITKSIQNEYVLLMENAFSEKYKYAFRNLELKELRRFILKELISSPELDNQLTNLIVLLNKFWDTHAAALITEVRASKSYRFLTRLLKCPDAFNIIYIMRTYIVEAQC